VTFFVAEDLVGRSWEAAPDLADMILGPVAAVDNCMEVDAVE
jgi:hypothetical protein